MRRGLTIVLALIAGTLIALGGVGPASAADKDCSDFDTQSQAQTFFINNGGPSSDPHRLDADGDGRACDSLPCPCGYADGGDADGLAGTRRMIQYARVTKVVDGDTIDVRLHSGAFRRVRMIGIDTPEVYGGTECGGPQASRSLKSRLPVGTRVKLVSDPTQARVDRYDRLLRYVIKRSTGRDMNRAQLWQGWARVYVYNHKPFERVTSYRRARDEAKAAPRGLWKVC